VGQQLCQRTRDRAQGHHVPEKLVCQLCQIRLQQKYIRVVGLTHTTARAGRAARLLFEADVAEIDCHHDLIAQHIPLGIGAVRPAFRG
jgi:hypothetical protein